MLNAWNGCTASISEFWTKQDTWYEPKIGAHVYFTHKKDYIVGLDRDGQVLKT